jgi:DNA adenine methylase
MPSIFSKTPRAIRTHLYIWTLYFVKGHKLYKNFYQPADHIEIAKELKRKRKSKWVVSYDDVPEIRDAYSAFSPITYLLNYSAGEKSVGTEVIFVSDALSTPDVRGFNMHHDRRPRVVDKKRSLRRSPGKLQIKNRKSDSK